MKLFFTKHTILFDFNDSCFLIYQSATRKGIIVEKSFTIEDFKILKSNKKFLFQDISTFSLSDSLVENPNGIIDKNKVKLYKESKSKIIDVCKQYFILGSNQEYINKLGPKKSFFDKEHIGNFHQHIGEHLFKYSKKDSEEWWIFQKFEKNLNNVRNNPYKWVQEDFMKSFFTKKLLNKKSVLDFGCGIGYYSKFFSKHGAIVKGVDPSKKYIDIANKNNSKIDNIKFSRLDFNTIKDFAKIKDSFDIIFLSDVLLYFFVPYQKIDISPSELLSSLSTKLKPNGKIYIMDPHGIFHLHPWFNLESPVLVMTEYFNRKYRVTPNLEEISIAIENAGLSISKIRELRYSGNDNKFYSEFPFWWFFELIK